MKRAIWRERYLDHGFPAFPCPRCQTGALRLNRETLKQAYEPVRDNDHHDQRGRFSGLLVCSSKWCGQVVSIGGDLIPGWDYDQDGEQIELTYFYPRALVSEVPVITIPSKTPKEVEEPIRASFSLLWADRGAAANKLRISIERILDHYGVVDKGPKGWWLSLDNRIKEFEKMGVGHHDTLDALRVVGNRGSHEGKVEFETMLDSYEVYEDALQDLFAGRSARLAGIRKRLKDPKAK